MAKAGRKSSVNQAGKAQKQQETLVEQSEKVPGVAEAIDAYRSLAPYRRTAAPANPGVRYSNRANP